MAKFFLFCAASEERILHSTAEFRCINRLAERDTVGRHSLVKDPNDADFIVFIGSSEPAYRDVRGHEFFKRYREKCAFIHSGDRTAAIIPGLYASLDFRWTWTAKGSAQSTVYPRVAENDSLEVPPLELSEAKYLYSFMGNALNHSVRKAILGLDDKRAYLENSAGKGPRQTDGIRGDNRERGEHYRDVLINSKFILCPRGIGTASWRLFETMRAGRVPVIISDHWVPSPGPQWERFSLRIAESKIANIPEVLRAWEISALAMSHIAREEWLRFYDANVVVDTLLEQICEVMNSARNSWKFGQWTAWFQALQPHFIRHWFIGPAYRAVKRSALSGM